jgi:hypothetical protein
MSAGLTRIKALLRRSSFARNVVVLAGGTAVVQAIVVLALPILTRLYNFRPSRSSNCSRLQHFLLSNLKIY